MKKIKFNKIDLIIIIIYLVLPMIFFLPILLVNNYMVRGDGLGYLAGAQFIRDSITCGELPLWNRFNASGVPFIADIQNKFFYPFMIMFLFFSSALGFKLYFLIHLSLAGIFMFFYLKKIELMRIVAFFGGIMFMFSNLLIIRFEHINIMNCIVWVPLMLLLVEDLVKTQKKSIALILGIIMAIQFFGGFPQTVLYTDITVFIYYMIISYNNKIPLINILKKAVIFVGVYLGLAAIQITPLIEIMLFSGRNSTGYGFFSAHPFDLRMLINMIFPRFWGDWINHLHISTEFPTDIYLSVIILNLLLYAISFHNKKFRIKIFIGMMIGSLLFSCSPQILNLGHILYKIPIINSFRVPSRAMFVFVISGIVIASISLDKIFKDKEYKQYFKFNIVLFLIISLISVVLFSISNSYILKSEFIEYYKDFSKIYLGSILLSLINVVLSYILFLFRNRKNNINIINIVVCILCLFYVCDVYYINRDYGSTVYRIDGVTQYNIGVNDIESNVVRFLKRQPNIENYRFILDYDIDKYGYLGNLGLTGNNNLISRVMSMQSYITFENKNYLDINNANNGKYISLKNSSLELFSMFSNKYIIKRNEDKLALADISSKNVLYENTMQLNLNIKKDIPNGVEIPLKLQKNSNIQVEVNLEVDNVPSKFLTIDLWGANGYDLQEANKEVAQLIIPGKNELKFVLNTGDVDIPNDSVLRIVGYSEKEDCDIKITKLIISDIDEIPINNSKIKQVYKDNKFTIYENINAKPIVFAPEKVINVVDQQSIINKLIQNNDMAEISYVTGFRDMDIINTDIEILEVKNNSVSANVKSEGETFVNMSQCYYPGWNVYVDGEKSNLYIVNNVIQGVAIPAGEHEIVFKFQPKSLYLGAFISLITLIISIMVLFKNKIKNII